MIDLTDLMRKAESELLASETLMRATKTGILFGVLAASLQKYSKIPVTNATVLQLMEILARDGRLFELMPVTEAVGQTESFTVHDDAVLPEPGSRLSEEEQQAREEDIRIMRARGFREEEIQAILALGGLTTGGEVESRSDDDLARYEQEKRDAVSGVPRGSPVEQFTMTPPEELPDDLLKAVTS